MSRPNLLVLASMVIASVALVAPLHAEVKQSAPDGMLVAHELLVKAKPEVVYAALSQVGKWWAPAHTWSGKPANLSLDARAGGCFCEAWDGSTVEHGRVVMARSGQLLRLHASLGPLQEMALFGALTWTVTAEGSETKLSVTYRVSGDSMHGLDKFAPVVDGVIGEQAGRLKTFVETGAP